MDNYIQLYNNMYNKERKIFKSRENTDNKNIREKISFDSIFWIYYYLIYDKNNYILNNKNFKLKKKILYKKIEIIHNFKHIFQLNSYYKKNKVIDNLSNDDDINLMTFSYLCDVEDIIFIVNNNSFFYTNYPRFDLNLDLFNDEITKIVKKYVIIDEVNEKIINVTENELKEEIDKCKQKYIYVKNPQKILYSESNYKVNEIYDLADKLNISYNLKSKKSELYKLVKEKIKQSLYFQLI